MATQFSSLSFLSNWRTRFVYFLLLPIINILLLVLIDLQYSNSFNWYVAAASVVIDSAALSLQAMSQLLITDANLKIDIEVISKRPYSFYYWKTKALTSLIAGIVLGVINLVFALASRIIIDYLIEELSYFAASLYFWDDFRLYELELILADEQSLLFCEFGHLNYHNCFWSFSACFSIS